METMIGYAIVSSIVVVMVWQAISHLSQGRRKSESLLGALKMEDIEVENTLPPSRASLSQSLVGPRVEYSPEMTPFPSHSKHHQTDKRGTMKQEISELEETNIERYSVLDRTTEKREECKGIIELIQGLSKEYNIDSDVWSVTSFNELRKDGMETERKNLLNPGEKPEKSYVEKCLEKRDGPIIAASDYVRSFADQIRPYLSKPFYSFGTDGYGRSDGRKQLRKFFEVDKEHIVTYTLSALAKEQLIPSKYAEKAMKKYNIDKNKPIPTEL